MTTHQDTAREWLKTVQWHIAIQDPEDIRAFAIANINAFAAHLDEQEKDKEKDVPTVSFCPNCGFTPHGGTCDRPTYHTPTAPEKVKELAWPSDEHIMEASHMTYKLWEKLQELIRAYNAHISKT